MGQYNVAAVLGDIRVAAAEVVAVVVVVTARARNLNSSRRLAVGLPAAVPRLQPLFASTVLGGILREISERIHATCRQNQGRLRSYLPTSHGSVVGQCKPLLHVWQVSL